MLSERIYYLIESISDLWKLETEFGYNIDTKDGIQKLEQELREILPHVRDMEAAEDKQRFSLQISSIVNDAEDVIGSLTIGKNLAITSTTSQEGEVKRTKRRKKNPTNPTDCKIKALMHKIEGFHMAISSAPVYNFSTGNSQNYGHQQITGSISVYIGPNNSTPLVKRAPGRQSYGHVQNFDLVGFRWETGTLIHQLIQNDETRVVGIVGMGGCGKTTLAKHLYHHPDIKNHFAHKAWICVSQSWDKRDILYEILRQTKGAPMGRDMVNNWSDQEFAENIYQFLSSHMYLIVLDDVWAVDAWNSIRQALPTGKGSKFLVTSRNEAVPKLVDIAFFVLEPKPLNPDESFDLFCKRAFTIGDSPSEHCVKLGKDMVERCKGLPLAITALAGALRGKQSLSDWMAVSKNLTQRIMKTEDSTTQAVVNEVLALSYDDLPYYLRFCFLYLSVFPEDYLINAGKLMRLWIAECLITHDQLSEEETMLRAEEYLNELVQRYLVQGVSRHYTGRVKYFQIHDLIREMCVKNAKERGFLKESHRVALFLRSMSQLQKEQLCRDGFSSFSHPTNSSRLRSLTCYFPVSPLGSQQLMNNMCSELSKFKFLRVLMLWLDVKINCRLPEAIGNLSHLTYIGMNSDKQGINYVEMPESIGNLHNLLTLDLKRSWTRAQVKDLWKLKRLRHLYFPIFLTEDIEVAWRLDMLENLQTLRNARAGDWMLSEMTGLSPTIQELGIGWIKTQEHFDAVFHCPSILSDNLHTLRLQWLVPMVIKQQNMQVLQRCENLRKLMLYGEIQESKSTALIFPPNLVKLEISQARLDALDLMGILGNALPCLKVLRLSSDAFVGTELTCKAGSFLDLEQLELYYLDKLEVWTVERGAMPSLRHLKFESCNNLVRFPEGLRFISTLEEVAAYNMPDQFYESYQLYCTLGPGFDSPHPHSQVRFPPPLLL